MGAGPVFDRAVRQLWYFTIAREDEVRQWDERVENTSQSKIQALWREAIDSGEDVSPIQFEELTRHHKVN